VGALTGVLDWIQLTVIDVYVMACDTRVT
jgi:hypothetical protein